MLTFQNSEGAYRYQLDLNRKLSNTLALRFNAVRRQEKTFQDASAYKFEGETLAAVWQPFRHTSIRIEGERGKYDNVRGFAGINVWEQSARSNAWSTAGTYYTSDGVWVIQAAQSRGALQGANGLCGQPSLIEGRFVDVTDWPQRARRGGWHKTDQWISEKLEYSRRLRQTGPPVRHVFDYDRAGTSGPVSFELAYNRQNQASDRNDNAFDTTISVDVSGRPFIDAASDRKHFGTDTDAFRAAVVYNWKPAKMAGAAFRRDGGIQRKLAGQLPPAGLQRAACSFPVPQLPSIPTRTAVGSGSISTTRSSTRGRCLIGCNSRRPL